MLDTVQDTGRFGYRHLGINPGGAMDPFAAQLANALLGKELQAPLIELHFPAAQIFFEKEAVICLAGADFAPSVNDTPVPLHHPVAIGKKSVLKFGQKKGESRCYLAVYPGLDIPPWLNSYSTNLKAGAGGWQGRRLLKGDALPLRNETRLSWSIEEKGLEVLPWTANGMERPAHSPIDCIIGPEWNWLTGEGQEAVTTSLFQVAVEADRMGYRLRGKEVKQKEEQSLLSSGVSFGTVQLLPNGQLIILMADHQTTGGYPRILQVIRAHLPLLAQKAPGEVVQFRLTDIKTGEEKNRRQQGYLEQLAIACKFKMDKYLHAAM